MKIGIPISGINNSLLRQDATAQNIANINTNNYAQLRVTNFSRENGGVTGVVERTPIKPPEKNNVNLVTQMVNLVNNPNQEQTNVNTLRTETTMIGNLIDIKA